MIAIAFNVIRKAAKQQSERKTNAKRTMNGTIKASGNYAYHNFTNVEFTGVFAINANTARGTLGTIGIGDYHLFIKYGDKVYMEVKGVGEVVISFDELQKNNYWKHWKQYYDLSLLLINDKNGVVNDLVYNSDCSDYRVYVEKRVWWADTAFINYSMGSNKIKNFAKICYYKINPFDLENMEYTSKEDLDVFEETYRNTRSEYIDEELAFYNKLATEYHIEQNIIYT